MSTATTFLFTVGCILGAVWELARYAAQFGWALLLPKALLGLPPWAWTEFLERTTRRGRAHSYPGP